MFVAYLFPLQDVHLAMEDGIDLIERGGTKEEVIGKLKAEYSNTMAEEDRDEFSWGKCVDDERFTGKPTTILDPAYRLFIVELT